MARPALLVGRQRAGPVWRAAVGTLFEEGTCDAAQFLSAGASPDRVRRALDAVADALRRFHDAGGLHPDLHAGNLLLRERSDATEAVVVDLDGARLRRSPSARQRMAELMRLYRSLLKLGLVERIGRAGCARFLTRYTRRDRQLRRALLSQLPRECLRLRLHALGWHLTPGRSRG